MDRQSIFLQTFEISASVEQRQSDIQGLNRARILYRDGLRDCYTVLTVPKPTGEAIQKVVVTVMDVKLGETDALLAVEFEPVPDLDVFDLIPDDFGRSQGIVMRCRDVVDCVSTNIFRQFLSDVFSMAKVYEAFWKTPIRHASSIYLAGGLADASIQMAERIACARGLSPVERDVGISYALLHDIRLLWIEDRSKLTPCAAQTHGGNIIRIQNPINALATQDLEMALTMRQLLSRSWEQGTGKLTAPTRALSRRASLLKLRYSRPLMNHPEKSTTGGDSGIF